MGRTRSIKPGFFDNDILGDLSPLTRLLFIGLWCEADREGRLKDRPKRIKKALLGYDDVDTDGVDGMLTTLHGAGFIYRYKVQGEGYIQIVNFSKHQNPHLKETPSVIPPPQSEQTAEEAEPRSEELDGTNLAPEEHQPSTRQAPEEHQPSTNLAPDKHQKSTVLSSLVPYYLSPITGTLSPTPPHITGGGEGNKEEPRTGESLRVEMARGAGRLTPADHSTTPSGRGFNEFWVAYPRKAGRVAAEAAWRKLKPSEALLSEMLSAMEAAKRSRQWQRDRGQYIPHPATWLNQRRWEDEAPMAPANGRVPAHHQGNQASADSYAKYDTTDIVLRRIRAREAERSNERCDR